MQADEIPAIEREQGPLLGGGERQDFEVGQGLPAVTIVVQSVYIMIEGAQGMDDRQREVFVSEQGSH